MLNDSEARERIGALPIGPPKMIAENHQAVAANFGVRDYGKRLVGYYEQLLRAPAEPVEWLDPDRLLDEFLDPVRFNLLRT